MTDAPPLVVVAGATATGKTDLAIDLAERLIARGRPAEIISADSRQVYRGLDIGTAKVAAAERARVTHHGLDLVDPDEPFSVADYASDARRALAGMGAIGGVVILVGGTGLYLRAVARGLATGDLPSDAAVRARLEAELAADGLNALVTRLRALAPERAATIDLQNPRRVVRALEIVELAGDAPLPAPLGYPGPLTWVGLAVPDPVHRAWIARRARDQFDRGLIDEAEALRRRYNPTLPAFSAIGYTEAWSVLDGRSTLEEAIERDTARNVAFAKRQRTWFRGEPGIAWFDPSDGLPLAAIEAVTRKVE